MEETDWFAERQEKQQERCYWRRVGFFFFLLIVIIGLALLVYPKRASADTLIAKRGGDSVRLLTEPCSNAAILDQLKPEYHHRFRAGEGNVCGKKYQLCWISENGYVFMLYEDGDKGRLPITVFNRELGV